MASEEVKHYVFIPKEGAAGLVVEVWELSTADGQDCWERLGTYYVREGRLRLLFFEGSLQELGDLVKRLEVIRECFSRDC